MAPLRASGRRARGRALLVSGRPVELVRLDSLLGLCAEVALRPVVVTQEPFSVALGGVPAPLDGVLVRKKREGDVLESDRVERMFNGIGFEKSSAEIKAAIGAKLVALGKKIVERENRVAKVREAYGIDDAAYNTLLLQARARQKEDDQPYKYTTMSNHPVPSGGGRTPMEECERVVSSGVVANLFNEQDHIASERRAMEKLSRISNNIRPLPQHGDAGEAYYADSFQLNYHELDYLGF